MFFSGVQREIQEESKNKKASALDQNSMTPHDHEKKRNKFAQLAVGRMHELCSSLEDYQQALPGDFEMEYLEKKYFPGGLPGKAQPLSRSSKTDSSLQAYLVKYLTKRACWREDCSQMVHAIRHSVCQCGKWICEKCKDKNNTDECASCLEQTKEKENDASQQQTTHTQRSSPPSSATPKTRSIKKKKRSADKTKSTSGRKRSNSALHQTPSSATPKTGPIKKSKTKTTSGSNSTSVKKKRKNSSPQEQQVKLPPLTLGIPGLTSPRGTSGR